MYDLLILDDDPLLRMLFADALSGKGFIVREAGSAAEAWAVLRQPAGTRGLLADQALGAPPGEPDGFIVADEALQFYPALVVIYASARTDALGGRALIAREHALPKPFMLKALLAVAGEIRG